MFSCCPVSLDVSQDSAMTGLASPLFPQRTYPFLVLPLLHDQISASCLPTFSSSWMHYSHRHLKSSVKSQTHLFFLKWVLLFWFSFLSPPRHPDLQDPLRVLYLRPLPHIIYSQPLESLPVSFVAMSSFSFPLPLSAHTGASPSASRPGLHSNPS